MPKSWDKDLAFALRNELPALVTNKAGTWKLPCWSVNSWNASLAAGNSFFPLTITPSMSNRNPKRHFGKCCWYNNIFREMKKLKQVYVRLAPTFAALIPAFGSLPQALSFAFAFAFLVASLPQALYFVLASTLALCARLRRYATLHHHH